MTGQPDYTLERVKVSPTGSVYHPLLGDLEVAGMTIPQLTERLTKDLSEYLINPKVSVALLEANSAKIGVLGDVMRPGILVMNKPMNVLEAITASGGIADTGDKSGVIVLRALRDGRAQTFKVNVKRILEGKAGRGGKRHSAGRRHRDRERQHQEEDGLYPVPRRIRKLSLIHLDGSSALTPVSQIEKWTKSSIFHFVWSCICHCQRPRFNAHEHWEISEG